MRIIYSLFILFYGFSIRLASVFDSKAALWINGRKNIFKKIENALKENSKPLIWIHAASLGEFEQGRPIIEALKAKHPKYGILLTFFSPSGYEVRKDYELADFVFYLPLDTPKNACRFLEIALIKLAIFIKYEYWYNYLNIIHKKEIPIIFVSAIFRNKQPFFKFYGVWFLKHLKQINWFFVQNQQSFYLLENVGILNADISGDTRFDRVAKIAQNAKANNLVEIYKGNAKLLLAGSSWLDDEALIYPLLNKFPELKIIIAPHQIDEKHIQNIKKNVADKFVLYSKANIDNVNEKQVLIIDNYGLLSSLYRYADFTFIGGGFGVGIHNTLEAATFGMPIFIGPNYKKFQEAKDLVELGAVEVVKDSLQLEKSILHLLTFSEKRLHKGQISRDYVKSKTGATNHIISYLERTNIL
ncbi:MAG: 3-deoxy-D-manno-octulosonic acid transferase [Bacteroidales bacterium]|jgi:3-deoxy-D-manno-octulosonic-acid transferase|nr:3-deoxy-D-manno-octulosonic acid transferase [Bacteroidales bacterium]